MASKTELIAGVKEQSHKLIIDTLKKYPEIEKAVVFGSRAMGNHKNGSDIDLAIYGNILESVKIRISSELNEEKPLPYHFDVVAYDNTDNKELKDHIDKFGKAIYTKE